MNYEIDYDRWCGLWVVYQKNENRWTELAKFTSKKKAEKYIKELEK